MATYYVWSGATGTNAGTSWTNAYTAFGSAVTAATTAGDVIYVHYTHQENLAANTTYTFGAAVIVVSVDKDASDAPIAMGESGWVGSNSAARAVTLAGAFKVYIYGLTIRATGGSAQSINTTDGGHFELESCKLWLSGTAANTTHVFGMANNCYTRLVDFSYKCGKTSGGGNNIAIRGIVEIVGGSAVSTVAPTTGLFIGGNTAAHSTLRAYGFDMSGMTSASTLVGNTSSTPFDAMFAQCKLPTSATIMGAQTTHANKSQAQVRIFDCDSGDTHLVYQYHDAFGSLVLDSSVYYTTTTYSWKIDTTANCSYYTPFVAPIFGVYHSGTSAVTPYVEILRDGSATAYQTDEVWLQVGAKTTAGSTRATLSSDRCTLANKLAGTLADQAAGAGTGSWTGEGGTAWSGKIDSGSSLTPAEVGDISAQVCVGEPSITVYVDPVIRT